MPLLRYGVHYEIQFIGESHIQHAVRLVQHYLGYVGKVEYTAVDHVFDPSGGSDDHVDTFSEPVCLFVYACSAVDGYAPVSGIL